MRRDRLPLDAPRPPRTALEFLDREERRSLVQLEGALASLGEDLCAASELRELVRKHPGLALGAGAGLGFLAAPFVADLARAVLPLALRLEGARSGGLRQSRLGRIAEAALRAWLGAGSGPR